MLCLSSDSAISLSTILFLLLNLSHFLLSPVFMRSLVQQKGLFPFLSFTISVLWDNADCKTLAKNFPDCLRKKHKTYFTMIKAKKLRKNWDSKFCLNFKIVVGSRNSRKNNRKGFMIMSLKQIVD